MTAYVLAVCGEIVAVFIDPTDTEAVTRDADRLGATIDITPFVAPTTH